MRSTIAAECLIFQEGLESAVFYRKFLEEMTEIQFPVIAYADNKCVIESLKSTKLVHDKRLRIDIAAVSGSLKTGEITEIRWCAGKKQLANCMTKRGASGLELLDVFHQGKLCSDI